MNKILYVRHSGRTLDLSAITDLFATVGDVENSRLEVIPASTNATKMGVFEMSTEQQASDCADRFHGFVFNGQPLSVRLRLAAGPSMFLVSNERKKRKADGR